MRLYAKVQTPRDGEPWRSARAALLADPDAQLDFDADRTGTS
jgi:hypothetical protein